MSLDSLAVKASQVSLDYPEQKDCPVSQDSQDQRENPECQVCQDKMGSLEFPEIKDCRDHLDYPDCQVSKEKLGDQVPLDSLALKENPAQQYQDHLACQDSQV